MKKGSDINMNQEQNNLNIEVNNQVENNENLQRENNLEVLFNLNLNSTIF